MMNQQVPGSTTTSCFSRQPARAFIQKMVAAVLSPRVAIENSVCATLALAPAMPRSRSSRQVFRSVFGSTPMLYEDRTYLIRFEADPETGKQQPCVEGQARWRKEGDGRISPLWRDAPAELNRRGYFPIRLIRLNASFKEIIDWCSAAAVGDRAGKDELQVRISEIREKVKAHNVS